MSNELISAVFKISQRIRDICDTHHILRKKTRLNFNFMYGLVRDKAHIEKYHSNFIFYLLDPSESHDCDGLFLELFLHYLSRKAKEKDKFKESGLSINDILNKPNFNLEATFDSNRIDITFSSSNTSEWFVFIENKVRSGEGDYQLMRYATVAKKNYKKWLGIYLTPNGEKPNLTDADLLNVICLDYTDIIKWLEDCRNTLSEHQNISFALLQYINIIKEYITNTMENKEQEEILNFMKEKPKGEMAFLFENNFREAMDAYQAEVRQPFFEAVKNKLCQDIRGIEEFKIKEGDENYLIKWNFLGNESGLKFIDETRFKGNYWQIFTNGEPEHSGLSNGNWEGLMVNGINDYDNKNQATAEIIKSDNKDELIANTVCGFLENIIQIYINGQYAKLRSKLFEALQKEIQEITNADPKWEYYNYNEGEGLNVDFGIGVDSAFCGNSNNPFEDQFNIQIKIWGKSVWNGHDDDVKTKFPNAIRLDSNAFLIEKFDKFEKDKIISALKKCFEFVKQFASK